MESNRERTGRQINYQTAEIKAITAMLRMNGEAEQWEQLYQELFSDIQFTLQEYSGVFLQVLTNLHFLINVIKNN